MNSGLSGSMSAFKKAAPMTCLLSCAAIVALVNTDAVATVGEAVFSFDKYRDRKKKQSSLQEGTNKMGAYIQKRRQLLQPSLLHQYLPARQ